MLKIKTRHLRVISRRFWGIFFGCIIAFAVIVQIFRQAFPLMNDYRDVIAEALGNKLGVVVQIEHIDAVWKGLRPEVNLDGLTVLSKEGELIFSVSHAQAELSILDSFLQKGMAWRTINFKNFKAVLEQQKNSSWRIQGYSGGTANNENPFNFDDPLDVFFFGRRVNIVSAQLSFKFVNGNQSEVSIPKISLENDRFFHRMTAAFNIEGEESLRLVIEGYGDPRNREKFAASGYARLKNVPTADVYSALVLSESSAKPPIDLPGKNTINLELWFRGSSAAGMTAKGHLSVDGLPPEMNQKFDFPQNVVTDFTAAWSDTKGWFVTLQNLNIDWMEKKFPLDSVAFYGNKTNTGMRIAEVDVGAWTDVALSSIRDKESNLYSILSKLNPSAQLENLDVQLTTPDQGYFLASTNFESAGISAFKGSPEIRNVHGYAEASLNGGYADVIVPYDFFIHVKAAYEKPFVIDDVKTQVSWETDFKQKIAYLNAPLFTGLYEGQAMSGSIAMELPFKRSVGVPKMDLNIHAESIAVSEHELFVPKHVPSELTSWLTQALNTGQAKNLDVFFSGPLISSAEQKPSYQFAAELDMPQFQFHPDWPSLEQMTGRIVLDSNNVSAAVSSGTMLGNTVRKAHVWIPRSDEGHAPIMTLDLSVQGDLTQAKRTVLASPLKSTFAPVIKDWDLVGDYDAEMRLDIPLGSDSSQLDYSIDATVAGGSLHMQAVDLRFEDIEGYFHYDKDGLASSDPFSARLWGAKFNAQFSSDIDTRIVQLGFSGEIDSAALGAWAQRPAMTFLSGAFLTEGTLRIPLDSSSELKHTTLAMQTPLKGARIDLPAPLGKSIKEGGDYRLVIDFEPDMTRYVAHFNDQANLELHYSESNLAMAVRIGTELDGTPELRDNTIVVDGGLSYALYDDWNIAIEMYQDALAEYDSIWRDSFSSKGLDPPVSDVIVTDANINVDTFQFEDMFFGDLSLAIAGTEDGWRISGEGEEIRGQVFLPSVELSRAQVDIEYVSVFEERAGSESEQETEVSALLDFDFADVASADVRIQKLMYEGNDWGEWDFSVDPIENGMAITDLHAEVRKLSVGADSPAAFIWTKIDGLHTSHFSGTVVTQNVGDALVAWQQERLLESETGSFDIDARWNAPPDVLSLANIYGDISLDVKSGSFIRGAEAGENPLLRLIALFNFDTLARRLRLDFSDLAAKGFAYDRVQSDMSFADGIVTLSDPLVVTSSSSKMKMIGTIDAVNETVDSELVVTLPVAGNLAVATAFIAGLPAGLGVYVISKLFSKQVDKVSSINYSVTGDWEDPKIKVKKIFDDSPSRKKSKSVSD